MVWAERGRVPDCAARQGLGHGDGSQKAPGLAGDQERWHGWKVVRVLCSEMLASRTSCVKGEGLGGPSASVCIAWAGYNRTEPIRVGRYLVSVWLHVGMHART